MAKQKRKEQNVVSINERQKEQVPKFNRRVHVEIIPRNLAQEKYVTQLNSHHNRIIFALGPAGTGKTLLAVLKSIEMLRSGEINRIVITRPAVGAAGENHGFLPGDINDKMEPWLLPILDIFGEYWTSAEIKMMIEEGIIEFAPLMYMRGRTFKDCCILLDESQNTTPEQMKLILTRIGEGTRVFVTGDLEQTDHRKTNGLLDITRRLEVSKNDMMAVCKFDPKDIERDPVVQAIVELYQDTEE